MAIKKAIKSRLVHPSEDKLTPPQRALLVLRDLEDLSEREAADALGVELGTVKSGLHRARHAFRERWEP